MAFLRLGYNLIIEGTLRTSEVPMATAKLLRECGYGVSLALMAVKPEISLVSCQLRLRHRGLFGLAWRSSATISGNANALYLYEGDGGKPSVDCVDEGYVVPAAVACLGGRSRAEQHMVALPG